MRRLCLWVVLALSACGKEPPPPPAPAPAPAPARPPEIASAPAAKPPEWPARKPVPEVGNYPPPPAGLKLLRAAVAGFQDQTTARVADAASEQLEVLVRISRRFSVIERDRFKALVKEQGLEAVADPLELVRPGNLRGVDLVFFGTVLNFRLSMRRPAPVGEAPLDLDASRTTIAADIGVVVRLVNPTTGEIISNQVGELKREMRAAEWGIRVLGIGGDAKDSLQVDRDTQGKLLRVALDEAVRKMLPTVDGYLSRPAASICPKCKTELPEGSKSCAKCGTSPVEKCTCGAELQAGSRFCGKCGKAKGR